MTRLRATRRSQPRNEPRSSAGFPAVDAPADRQEQFLHHVAGVGVLQSVLPQASDKSPAHKELRTPPRPRDLRESQSRSSRLARVVGVSDIVIL